MKSLNNKESFAQFRVKLEHNVPISNNVNKSIRTQKNYKIKSPQSFKDCSRKRFRLYIINIILLSVQLILELKN